MDDNDAKTRATPKDPAVKPGACAEGGALESNSERPVAHVRTTTDPPESMCLTERDVLAKQQGANTAGDVQMKPGAVAVVGIDQSHASRSTTDRVTGVSQQTPNSRLVSKLRGELPDNWDASAPALSTLEQRENQIQSKLRETEPRVNSTLVDRESQVQSKIQESGPPVNSNLMYREERIQGKIRSTESATPGSIPGALTRLSHLEDSITSKQETNQGLLSIGDSPPMQLQQREGIATAKSGQIARNVDVAPQRLQQVETMLERKMIDGTVDNANQWDKNTRNNAIEYGEYGGLHEADLAVALAVDEEDGAGSYLPAAIEYDPDAKPPLYRSYRFRLYTCVVLIAAVIGTIGAVLGIILTIDDEEVQPITIQYRETLGIRENIELVVEDSEKLDDFSSPYRKALDWIMFDDPMALTPESPRLIQRYIAAYLFHAISAKKPWLSGCSPPQDGEDEACSYLYIQESGEHIMLKAKRWLSNSSECEWAGIKCDDLFQIREFDLSGPEHTGAFPEGVTLLPFIQLINLAHGKFEGPLPGYLSDAKHLVSISLQNNTFTGTLPDRWFESRSFQRILLNDNNITGTITANIAKLKDLKTLDLDGNSLEGSIPKEFGDILNLYELQLEKNLLIGSIPTHIGLLTEIENFNLGRNKLTGTIPSEIGFMEKLFSVRLHVNLLTGSVPEQFWTSEKIAIVDLSGNRLNGTVSTAVGRLADLSELIISDNQFSGSLPKNIANLSDVLIKIVATRNNLNGTVDAEICMKKEGSVIFKTLQLDCKEPANGGAPEIFCDCCTRCCDSDGENCVDIESEA